MSDLADILWQQFGAEAGEHLDLVERELGETPALAGDERIAGLFRAFHSVKGLAAAMGVTAMEAIAHSGESLLARVRDGAMPLDPSRRLLVEVCDTLRAMAEEALAARGDVPARPELVERLQAARLHDAPPATDPAVSPGEAMSADPRILALGGRLASTMEDLVAALRPDAPADALGRLDDDLLALDAQAGELGFQGLRRQVRQLSRAAHAGRPGIDLLHDLGLALGVIEEVTGRSAGAGALRSHVAQSGAGELVRLCARAGELLRRGGEGHGMEAAQLLEAAVQRADLLDLSRSADLLRLAIDMLRRSDVGRDGFAAINGAVDRVGEAAAENPPADADPIQAARLDEMLRAVFAGKGIEATIERAMALGVGRPLLEQLSDEARERLAIAIDDPGQVLVEVDGDLDSDGHLADAFARWAADNADQITSRVSLVEGVHRTLVLLATPARPATVTADLGALDRTGERLRVTICDGQAPVTHPGESAAMLPAGDELLRVPARVIDDILERLGDLMPVAAALEGLARTPVLGGRQRDALLHGRGEREELEAVVDLIDARHDSLRRMSDTFGRALKGLRDAALELRIVPVDLLFGRYPRLVRELARTQGKSVALRLEPNGARLDKGMVERLADPLMHMVRNAVDHGVESPEDRAAAGKAPEARLVLRATQRGEHVTISLSDDGRGIDPARVRERAVERGRLGAEEAAAMADAAVQRLVLEPGFSTAREVTATSGRGVGMDVVATVVAELGGAVTLESRPGEGTTIRLELPLSVALQSTLVLEQSGQVFAVPDRHVAGVARHAGGATIELPGHPVTPVVPLGRLLGLPESGAPGDQVVVLSTGARRLGIAVDRVVRRADVLVRESHPVIAAIPGLGGASRLGDGSIVLLLDPDGLIGLAGGR